MLKKAIAVAFAVAALFMGCQCDTTGVTATRGTISIELPAINAKSSLPGVSDIALYTLEITSDGIGYSNTIESRTGGTITVEKLEEARYEIAAAAADGEGTTIFTGRNHADVYVGEVAYVEIQLEYVFGNLDIALLFPEQDDLCTLELEGIVLDTDPIKVINGPTILIERLVGGRIAYTPGSSSMRTFSIETSGENAANLKLWTDNFDRTRNGSLIVYDLAGTEAYRWNMYELAPLRYETDSDGNTRFDFSLAKYQIADPPTTLYPHYNEETDKGVEISGVTPGAGMQAATREDRTAQTLTIIFGYESGLSEVYAWTERVAGYVAGINPGEEKKSMSVITWGPGGPDQNDEIARRNYFEVFPIRFEQIDGFSTDIKGYFRLVLSFDWAEDSY